MLNAPHGPATFKKPVLYQMDGNKKTSVEGSFEVAGTRFASSSAATTIPGR